MRKYGKVDANHSEIVDALRKIGASVQSIASVGSGCPDLVVGFRGRNYLFEIKGQGAKLTEDEHDWHRDWKGLVDVVHSIEETFRILGFK